jgi:hypothetical protein
MALVMAEEKTEEGIGLELIELEAGKILFDELNDEIDTQQEKWNARDEDWNTHTGQNPGYIVVEYIEPENYNKGHRPSLIEAPKENYPNLSVMAYQARPVALPIDQASSFNVFLDIELMVKGETEYEVNARIHRTTEAVHQVLTRNEKLNGTSQGWENDPTIQITDCFKRRSETSSGEEWFWQASRLRYQLIKHSKLPEW